MSEVNRYAVIPDMVYGHDKFGPVCRESEEPHFVLASEYDTAQSELAESKRDLENWQRKACETAEREAALREELASRNEVIAMKAREVVEAQTAVTGWAAKHKAAEQRNALVESLLRESLEEDDGTSDWIDRVIAALRDKPTESGASE